MHGKTGGQQHQPRGCNIGKNPEANVNISFILKTDTDVFFVCCVTLAFDILT